MLASSEFFILERLIKDSLHPPLKLMNKKGLLLREDFDDLFCVFHNLLIRPELTDYSDLHSILILHNSLTNINSAFANLSKLFFHSFFNSISYILTRIRYEYHVNLKLFLKINNNTEGFFITRLNDLKEKELELWTIAEKMHSLSLK